MALKTIIVDDEAKLRKVLSIKLADFCPNVEVLDSASNATEAYEKILNLNPDLIFLDISMPEESGFDLLNKFEKLSFEVIFVTGYDEYALDALKLSAIDYLLKPVRTSDLVNAVKKAEKRIEEKDMLERYDLLQHNINHLEDKNAKIAIPGAKSYDFVEVNEIIRCEGWQKYTKIYLSSGVEIVSSYNIGVYKELLNKFNFFTCHKSHLINVSHIKKYLKEGTVRMVDNSLVPVSRRKKEEFLEQVVRNL